MGADVEGAKLTSIVGVVVHGYGVASGQSKDSPYPAGTVSMQAPLFRDRGLDLSGFHLATLNVSIAPLRFRMKSPEFTFLRVRWTELPPPEDFSLSHCYLTARGVRRRAMVYYPHPETKARHFVDDQTLEIIAPYITGIRSGSKVELEIRTSEIEISGRRKGDG